MTTLVFSGITGPFGGLSTNLAARLIKANADMERLKDAVANASAGYAGTPGTEFEATNPPDIPNLFGVMPSMTPGENGTDYRFAMDSLSAQWATFWAAAEPFIAQLDNGQAN